MSFVESPRFPAEVSFDSVTGQIFSTAVETTLGGREHRNRNWAEPKRTFDLALKARRSSDVKLISAFFRLVGGQEKGFRLKDWTDYVAANQAALSITSTTYQLRQSYFDGLSTSYRNIVKPIASTSRVFVGGVLQSSGVTLNATTGILTFAVAPGAVVTWSGEFDTPVRFLQDEIKWSAFDREPGGAREHWFNAESLQAIEVRI